MEDVAASVAGIAAAADADGEGRMWRWSEVGDGAERMREDHCTVVGEDRMADVVAAAVAVAAVAVAADGVSGAAAVAEAASAVLAVACCPPVVELQLSQTNDQAKPKHKLHAKICKGYAQQQTA